ncbi:serine/threonine-protein kinase OSR1 isoform X2 [Capsicum annuum]|uniref:serine/threonine-protein kinase OSR1 isoform X2 n=1 Tax=Capsicum annuum TaxID=4072 RepID=UPI0007BFA0BC|nr:serine/threonine-protein kinase OSR1 isoform X2 [Capsicum annuum]
MDKKIALPKKPSEKRIVYPIGSEHYTVYEEIGQGVSALVHRSLCIPLNEIVAIKILDFERDKCDLSRVSQEAKIMVLSDHPNVLKLHCSFVCDYNLWVVMPYMAGGSCLHILKAAYPDGFKEVVIATILREVLKALEYLHDHGYIHRDVKAGNILIDSHGGIKLGDFGVSAYLFDSGDRQRVRNTFAGTPCWMAPEVMEQLHGYDCKADIWSFGITALELAHGHAPFSKFPPMKVLLMTLQNEPPSLDDKRDRKFSGSFREMIGSCLVKDPSKRPSAKKLLKHAFFKKARSNDYISRTLLKGLPDLGDSVKALKRKEEDLLAQKKIPDGQKEEMSQNEYKRGISCWNFDLEDLKAQASLIPDEETICENDHGGSTNSLPALDQQGNRLQYHLSPLELPKLQYQFSFGSQSSDATGFDDSNPSAPPSPADRTMAYSRSKCEKFDDDLSIASSIHEAQISQHSSPCREEMNLVWKREQGTLADEGMPINSCQSDKSSSQNVFSCNMAFPQTTDDFPAEVSIKHSRISAGSIEDFEEKTKYPVVQQKGRFKVTSETVDLEKVNPENLTATQPLPPDPTVVNLSSQSIRPMLQNALQATNIGRESILSAMKQVTLGDSTVNAGCIPSNSAGVEKSLLEAALDREKDLHREVADLRLRLERAQEELQKYKTENKSSK